MFRVGLLVVVVAAVGPAVAARAGAASGLHGKVTRGPITPVCREGQPCEAPAAHTKLVFRSGDRVVARTTTNAQGTYRVRLRPGRYTVRLTTGSISRIDPASVRVLKGRFRRIDFSIDTGIR